MISLLVVIIIVCVTYGVASRYKRISPYSLLVGFFVSLSIGVILDNTLGVYGLWHYVQVPFHSFTYWWLIPLAWGVFGVWVICSFSIPIVGIILCTILVGGVSEIMGYVRHIWAYNAPLWLIVIGWFLLIAYIKLLTDYTIRLGTKYHVKNSWFVKQFNPLSYKKSL